MRRARPSGFRLVAVPALVLAAAAGVWAIKRSVSSAPDWRPGPSVPHLQAILPETVRPRLPFPPTGPVRVPNLPVGRASALALAPRPAAGSLHAPGPAPVAAERESIGEPSPRPSEPPPLPDPRQAQAALERKQRQELLDRAPRDAEASFEAMRDFGACATQASGDPLERATCLAQARKLATEVRGHRAELARIEGAVEPRIAQMAAAIVLPETKLKPRRRRASPRHD